MRPAAQTLDLDVVVQAQQEHGDGQAQRGGQVGGGHHAQVVGVAHGRAGGMPDGRQQVNRQHVHEVHHEDPDKHRQRQRRHQLAAVRVVNDRLGLRVDHFNQHLHGRLEPTRNTGGGFASGKPQHEADQSTDQGTHDHRVDVDDRKVDDRLLLLVGQMNQVVADVFARGQSAAFSCHVRLHRFVGNSTV
ncbi:hypothetical protein FQZ97_732280 [compost metagenome]